MGLVDSVVKSLEEDIEVSRNRFIASINTDENADYRRGFVSRELFARLAFKEIVNAAIKRQED